MWFEGPLIIDASNAYAAVHATINKSRVIIHYCNESTTYPPAVFDHITSPTLSIVTKVKDIIVNKCNNNRV
jgi:hypothetical protein